MITNRGNTTLLIEILNIESRIYTGNILEIAHIRAYGLYNKMLMKETIYPIHMDAD